MSRFDSDLDRADKFRLEGNLSYKEGKYRQAVASYTKVPLMTNHIHTNPLEDIEGARDFASYCGATAGPNKEQMERALKIKVDVKLNWYQCEKKLGNVASAIKHVEDAIKLDAKCSKAYWYRGRYLLEEKRDYDRAEPDLKKAYQAYPNDRDVKKAYQELCEILEQRRVAYEAEKKRMFGGMFQRGGKMYEAANRELELVPMAIAPLVSGDASSDVIDPNIVDITSSSPAVAAIVASAPKPDEQVGVACC